jgi:XTP/dITP diphosphohydrolase
LTKILIASHNQNKITEIKDLIKDLKVELISLKDLGDQDEVIEDGKTFFENAYKKALYFANKYQMPTLSDDSGLCVNALDEKPGILSARYTPFGDLENNLKVLKEMENNEHRSAYFICVIVYIDMNREVKSFEGRVYGEIYNQISGANGFGYDSIFYYPKLKTTFGNLSKEEKNQISHRYVALSKLKEYLYETTHHK